MTTSLDLFQRQWTHALGLMGLLCCASLALPAQASDSETPGSATGLPQLERYTTRAGDSLERIAQQRFRNSPIQQAVLVKMLQEHNPLLLGAVQPRQRLQAGWVLALPTHEQLVRQVLKPYLQEDASPPTSNPEQPKNWVRYP